MGFLASWVDPSGEAWPPDGHQEVEKRKEYEYGLCCLSAVVVLFRVSISYVSVS